MLRNEEIIPNFLKALSTPLEKLVNIIVPDEKEQKDKRPTVAEQQDACRELDIRLNYRLSDEEEEVFSRLVRERYQDPVSNEEEIGADGLFTGTLILKQTEDKNDSNVLVLMGLSYE